MPPERAQHDLVCGLAIEREVQFGLAKRKILSPEAMDLPPYIVFCAVNENVFARGSVISVLIANMGPLCLSEVGGRSVLHPLTLAFTSGGP